MTFLEPTRDRTLISTPRETLVRPQWTTTAREAQQSSSNWLDQDRLVGIAHIRVGIATSGRDNIFLMWIPNVGPATGSGAVMNGQYCLDISEYNTFDLPLSKAYPSFSKIDSSGAVTVAQDVLMQT